jgi:hypothetical protein
MRTAVLVGTAALLMAGVAEARPDREAIEAFGLVGHWAISCEAAPSPHNPHVYVTMSDTSAPTRRLQTGDPKLDDIRELLDARLIGDGKLTMQQAVSGSKITFLLRMESGDRYRIDEMVTSDGKALVTHAVQIFDGKPSPWYHRCGN